MSYANAAMAQLASKYQFKSQGTEDKPKATAKKKSAKKEAPAEVE